ncbi:MAG TPA: glycosyltransferase family 4 protein [Terriglobia bacterium]|nr:glycosyltransferase family 4 protein [Terriglobia bacterium]
MKILYLSQYYPPECCAPARISELAREWSRAGHEVRVLTGFPNHPDGRIHPEYRSRWKSGFCREQMDGVEVCRTWLYPSANRGTWKRSANFLSFALSAAVAGVRIAPKDGVVIATSPPILVGAAGYLVARQAGLPFVFEVRDLWPESLEAVGQAAKNSALYRAVGRLANLLYKQAGHIVVDGEHKRRKLLMDGVPASKISVIRNGVAAEFLDRNFAASGAAAREVRRRLGLGQQFIAIYAGTLGMAHRLETVLEAAHRLRARHDVAFLLLGDGAGREKLLAQIREMNLRNVRILSCVPRESVPDYLAAADVCLVPLRASKVFHTAIPCKMFEAMAAAKPVILGVEGEAAEILEEARAGVCVRPEDAGALAAAVLHLADHPETARQLGRNGQHAIITRCSRRDQALAYLELLRGLVQGGEMARNAPEEIHSLPVALKETV